MSDTPVSIPTQIRRAFLAQLDRSNTTKFEEGRLLRYDEEDFHHPSDPAGYLSRGVINSLSAQGAEGQQFLGDCCTIVMELDISISLMLPVEYAHESELDALELGLWPLLARVVPPDGVSQRLVGVTTQPGAPDNAFPIAQRLITYAAEYGFDPMQPHLAVNIG